LESYKISKTTNSSGATHQKTDGRWARNNLEKANTFVQHLEKRFHPYPGLGTLPFLNWNDYLDKIPQATLREVAEEIRTNLNPKKAFGFDLITGEILKNKSLGQTDYANQCLLSAKLYSRCMENC
jgi:hypothetical protein